MSEYSCFHRIRLLDFWDRLRKPCCTKSARNLRILRANVSEIPFRSGSAFETDYEGLSVILAVPDSL